MDRPVNAPELLASYVEPQEPATRAQLRELAAHTVCPPHQKELEHLYSDDAAYKENVLKKRMTMLDLLEDYPACELPFERFLELLPSLKARYYSISSSPKATSGELSITVGVVTAPAWSGRGEYRGVASNYLAGLQKAIPPSVSSARRSRVSHCLKIRKRLSLWSEQAQELRRSGIYPGAGRRKNVR